MSEQVEFTQASIVRIAALSRLIAQIIACVNLAFLMLALVGQVWPRVLLLSIAELGFIACIYYSHISRFNGRVPWLLLAACWCAIINAVLTNGAGIGHVTLLWFALLICIAGLLGGARFGLYWAAIGALSITCVALCEPLGITIPNFTPEKQRYALTLLHTVAQMVCMAALVVAYSRTLDIYQAQVDEQIETVKKEVDQRKKAEIEAQLLAKNKEQFLRNISHEFRTPLNSIIGFSERLLKKCHDTPGFIKPLHAINRNGKSLHYFVNELLLLDAIEATPLQLTRASPCELVQSGCELYRELALAHDLRLELSLEEACKGVFVMVDVARMNQAFNNILLFCIRQSSHGVIHIRVSRSDDGLLIEFEDNARALTEVECEHLYETHYEYVLSNEKDIPCSAFSLKIAALIVGYHHWGVSARSASASSCRTAGGNCFSVSIPQALECVG